ncbi:DUF1636 domain-containing protein [Stakelama tenebrarum]|uniref:DUF1636 domain-containing protein n=1 Tax=Stakelama tenebrarum TaxID=2711215 RepID=A0A6G6Y378_9SPHN|nr:DUF1636 domain-containing protein [Sphingosinithalassobacter tenebrarum]QIG79063.1 DUF1636 domain-containing protein [Sphingosinithalassobacter tenebrarum]
MLQAVAPGASVVVCSTCRHSPESREDAAGRRGGALLAEALRAVQAGEPRYAGIAIQDMPCLFACSAHCTVHVRAPGKVGYVMGRFAPDEGSARAILDYAAKHAESEEGQVRYGDWPEGVKGHFLVRVPPEGFVAT